MTTSTGKPSLMDGLRKLRETHDNQGRVIDAPSPPVRTRPQLQFQQVDSDAHQRAVDAERQRLAREREIEQQADARTRQEGEKEDAAARGRKPYTKKSASKPQPQQKRASSNKAAPAAKRDPYAHLHADAHIIWQLIADAEQVPTIADLTTATGLSYGEVAHRARQLEANGVLRVGFGGTISLTIRPVPVVKPSAPVRPRSSDHDPETDRVLAFIRRHASEQGYPPVLREIAEACHFSTSAVTRHLERLERQGHISRDEGKSRGIRLLGEAAG